MAHLSKSSKSNFQLVLSKIPGTTVNESDPLLLNIVNTIIPSVTLDPIELNHLGVITSIENGIEYSPWDVTFHIDGSFINYNLILDWMMYIYDGVSRFGRTPDEYQIEAELIITDNFQNDVSNIRFRNIWPTSLSEVDLSYLNGNEKLECTVTFKYDYFKKL